MNVWDGLVHQANMRMSNFLSEHCYPMVVVFKAEKKDELFKAATGSTYDFSDSVAYPYHTTRFSDNKEQRYLLTCFLISEEHIDEDWEQEYLSNVQNCLKRDYACFFGEPIYYAQEIQYRLASKTKFSEVLLSSEVFLTSIAKGMGVLELNPETLSGKSDDTFFNVQDDSVVDYAYSYLHDLYAGLDQCDLVEMLPPYFNEPKLKRIHPEIADWISSSYADMGYDKEAEEWRSKL